MRRRPRSTDPSSRRPARRFPRAVDDSRPDPRIRRPTAGLSPATSSMVPTAPAIGRPRRSSAVTTNVKGLPSCTFEPRVPYPGITLHWDARTGSRRVSSLVACVLGPGIRLTLRRSSDPAGARPTRGWRGLGPSRADPVYLQPIDDVIGLVGTLSVPSSLRSGVATPPIHGDGRRFYCIE